MTTPADRKLELEKKKARLAAIKEEKRKREEERRALSGQVAGASPAGSAQSEDVDMILKNLLPDVELGPNSALTAADINLEIKAEGASVESSPTHTVYKSRGRVNLQKTDTVQVNIAPREQVLYNKTTQTFSDTGERESMQLQWDDDFGAFGEHTATSPEDVFELGESIPHLPHIELIKPAEKKEEETAIRELSEQERLQIMSSEEFQKFFDRTSRILERALTEEVDIFVDYARGPNECNTLDTGAKLSLQRTFFDDKWSKGRCVTSLDYCPQHPELLACSYNNNEDLPHEPDGVVLVWNTKFKKTTPEYIFHCQSRVVSTTFAKFHPNLLLGGTYSGQICLWDNRHNKRTPVQKSPLSTAAHTHPVYCIKVVGTQNAHNLISISTDGKLCSWSLDMLSQPQDSLDLQLKQAKSVAATCLSFPLNDVNNFIVGSEDGVAYGASRHGTKQGVTDVFEGHSSPMTGVSCHMAMGQIDFSHLFVTSSFDWTVKLWSMKESKPLYSFEDYQDYVMDVGWSPTNPALFACIDTTGRLDIWNINQDTEVAAASVTVEGNVALNKLLWMPSGQQICVGDEKGTVWLYDVGESVAVPRQDEWTRLSRTLHEIQQMNAETEEMMQSLSVMSSSPLR